MKPASFNAFLAGGRELAGAQGAERADGDRRSPHAESITHGLGTAAPDSWVLTGQAVLGWLIQLSCPGSIALHSVRQEDLYVF